MSKKKKMIICFIFGMLGCLCFGGGDWLMAYGAFEHTGSIWWLTQGVANISSARNSAAMALSFPGIIFYAIGLFGAAGGIKDSKERRIYRILNIFGLTPWLCLHIFYVELLNTYAVMYQNGLSASADIVCEGVFGNLSWIIILSEALMLPPFIYWIYLQIRGRTYFPRMFVLSPGNVLFTYAILYVVKMLLPESAFRVGFTNGLMSESMIFWFAWLLIFTCRNKGGILDGEETLTILP